MVSGQYQQGVVYAAKHGQAQGMPTHAAAQRRRGQHTQLDNTNTQDKEDKACAQCEAPLRCVCDHAKAGNTPRELV